MPHAPKRAKQVYHRISSAKQISSKAFAVVIWNTDCAVLIETINKYINPTSHERSLKSTNSAGLLVPHVGFTSFWINHHGVSTSLPLSPSAYNIPKGHHLSLDILRWPGCVTGASPPKKQLLETKQHFTFGWRLDHCRCWYLQSRNFGAGVATA